MGKRSGSGAGAYVALALSVVFVAVCGGLFWLASTGELKNLIGGSSADSSSQASSGSSAVSSASTLEPKEFAGYTWDEIGRIASAISSAQTDEEASSTAVRYGILSEDGALNDCVHTMRLEDGSMVTCRVVGIRQDDLADGSGKAGLTFLSYGYGTASMNGEATADGGWESSAMRSWLANDVQAILPSDVSSQVKAVSKLTNNQGASCDPQSAVSATADSLWLFSGAEIFGDVTWLAQEYGDSPIVNNNYVDFVPLDTMLSSEGSQYRYFSERGARDRAEFACVSAAIGSQVNNWWLRSCYPVQGTSSDEGYFYQVLRSGYPSTTLAASEADGVVVGFCL